MKVLIASFLLIGASTLAANAETFTFTATTATTNSVSAPVMGGAMVGATFGKGKSEVTYTSGRKATTANECASWSTPPGSQFQISGLCVFTEGGADKASIAFTCASNKTRTASDCWGALNGMEGRYKGKNGTISWHQSSQDNGKTGKAAGAGMWN